MMQDQINLIRTFNSDNVKHTEVYWSNGKRTCSCRHNVVSDVLAPNLREGFWDRLGYDEGLMPKHLPFSLTVDEQGPAVGKEIDHWGCWCGEPLCPLDKALREASGANDWVNQVGLQTWTHGEDGRVCLQRPSSGRWWHRVDSTWYVPCDREDHTTPVQMDSQGFRKKE